MIPNVCKAKQGKAKPRIRSQLMAQQGADAYTVPRRKMRRVMAVFLQEDGERACEDERGAHTDGGDLVAPETGRLGVGLGGRLEGQNGWDGGRWDASCAVERVVRLPYVKQPMAVLCSRGWNRNQPREAGSLVRTRTHVEITKTCGRGLSEMTRHGCMNGVCAHGERELRGGKRIRTRIKDSRHRPYPDDDFCSGVAFTAFWFGDF